MTLTVLQSFFAGEIFSNVNAFLLIMILISGLFGAASKRLSIAGFGAFVTFIYVATGTDLWIFESLMYIVIPAMLLVMGFRITNYSSGGDFE